MNTKEAKEYLEELADDQIEEFGYCDSAIEAIITLLKEYEKMRNDFKKGEE